MYIPFLANLIIDNKDKIIADGTINFKGILIGNGVMLT
jgi:carboxypeptidase C (cathepsin A)